jgi:hypothetical protein
LAITLAVGSVARADEAFRLEIGPAVAGGGVKLKNAVLMVRPRLCDDPASVLVRGSAEGVVDGVRQSVPLTLVAMPTAGVYAVTRQWGNGSWVLALTATCPARKATAGALVPLGGATGFFRDRSRLLAHAPGAAEIEASLAALGG